MSNPQPSPENVPTPSESIPEPIQSAATNLSRPDRFSSADTNRSGGMYALLTDGEKAVSVPIGGASRQRKRETASEVDSVLGPPGRQPRKTIYDRSLNRGRTAELSQAAFGYLFMEMVNYAQRREKRVSVDLEQSLNSQGYPIGVRLLDLLLYRTSSTSTSTSSNVPPPTTRPTRVLSLLQFIHTNLWKHLFGRTADALEISSTRKDEYMLTDSDQLVNRYISVPSESSQLNCAAFVAGIIEGVCDGAGFPPESVTAHWVSDESQNAGTGSGQAKARNIATVQGKTLFLIKFRQSVIEREEALGKK